MLVSCKLSIRRLYTRNRPTDWSVIMNVDYFMIGNDDDAFNPEDCVEEISAISCRVKMRVDSLLVWCELRLYKRTCACHLRQEEL